MKNLNQITYVDWQLKLNAIGEIAEGADDINQCIKIILMTPKGSVPHRPTFGSNIYKYIDYPVNEATPNIIREATDAINEWETRVEATAVKVEVLESNLKVIVEWTLKDSATNGTMEVSYDNTAS